MQLPSILAILCAIFVIGVFGWGQEGHEAIAQVASQRLTTQAQAGVKIYLNGRTLEQIAPFPDDYDHTPEGRWSGPMHYCNLPRDATQYLSKYCPIPPSCVVEAINNYTQRLLAEGTTGPQCNYGYGVEPCPLEFLVHFVGDVHQPLHVGYGYDEGGNKVEVSWYGDDTNLHHVWDDSMIQKYTGSDVSVLVSDLNSIISQEPSTVQQYLTVTQPAKWANESFQYVRTDVYQFNSSDVFRFGKTAQRVALGDWYYNQNLPIVKQRLVAAAVRLAQLLNNIFASSFGDVEPISIN